MYKHILIATDGSELAQKAEATGFALAKAIGAQVTLLTVTEPWDALRMAGLAESGRTDPVADYNEGMAGAARRILSAASEAAGRIGIACTTLHVKEKHPAEGIVEAATARGCDLIVMASHGRRGLSKLLLGSETTRVLTHGSLPVLVCR
jgi:nucleotide-binding universal stress UspA family protein